MKLCLVATLFGCLLSLNFPITASAQEQYRLNPAPTGVSQIAGNADGSIEASAKQRRCFASDADLYEPGPDRFLCLYPGSLIGTGIGMVGGGFIAGLGALAAGSDATGILAVAVLGGAPIGGAIGSGMGTLAFGGRDGSPDRSQVAMGAALGLAAGVVGTVVAYNSTDDSGVRLALSGVTHLVVQSVVTALWSANR